MDAAAKPAMDGEKNSQKLELWSPDKDCCTTARRAGAGLVVVTGPLCVLVVVLVQDTLKEMMGEANGQLCCSADPAERSSRVQDSSMSLLLAEHLHAIVEWLWRAMGDQLLHSDAPGTRRNTETLAGPGPGNLVSQAPRCSSLLSSLPTGTHCLQTCTKVFFQCFAVHNAVRLSGHPAV